MAGKKSKSKKFAKKAPVKKNAGESKMDKATKIYLDLTGRGLPRKAVMESFINDVGLTKAGASTYYQTIKNKEPE